MIGDSIKLLFQLWFIEEHNALLREQKFSPTDQRRRQIATEKARALWRWGLVGCLFLSIEMEPV